MQVFGCGRLKTQAYCRSAFGVGARSDGSHSWPLDGSALALLVGPGSPALGAIDSSMCGSVAGTGGLASGSPTILDQTFPSAIWFAVRKPFVRSIGSTAMSCQGTPTMPWTRTSDFSRWGAHPMPVALQAALRSA